MGPLGFVNSVLVLVEVGLGAKRLATDPTDKLLLRVSVGFRSIWRAKNPGGIPVAGEGGHLKLRSVGFGWRLKLVNVGQFP